MPVLALKICSHEENEETASLLVELLPGLPLDEALPAQDDQIRERATTVLLDTLRKIWNTTLR